MAQGEDRYGQEKAPSPHQRDALARCAWRGLSGFDLFARHSFGNRGRRDDGAGSGAGVQDAGRAARARQAAAGDGFRRSRDRSQGPGSIGGREKALHGHPSRGGGAHWPAGRRHLGPDAAQPGVRDLYRRGGAGAGRDRRQRWAAGGSTCACASRTWCGSQARAGSMLRGQGRSARFRTVLLQCSLQLLPVGQVLHALQAKLL